MANLRDIRRRIKSVKNTAQITKAMQMVAASKMRKAQQAALAGRDYAQLLNRVITSLRDAIDPSSHPLLERRGKKSQLVILMTTDKGLCGALNTNILREAGSLDPATTRFVSIGRKGTQFLARMRRTMVADFPLAERPTFSQCKQVSKFCIEKFLSGEVDSVSILFPRFVNTLTQSPILLPILPIASLEEVGLKSDYEPLPPIEGGIEFEPDAAAVLDAILPAYIHYIVYQTQLGTRASEHSARMVAMKNATDNAKSLIKDLTLEYNKARQAGITNEILEIATAQLALG
ncbi:MAG: ATP synthase F1 subunit gamma [Verrucomicrobia bacterium]|nr:ATP synthase F1 subunit gamma [Verrucomicrobiota bacterium]